MKKRIHPKYEQRKFHCSCGKLRKIFSTIHKNINIDVCGSCHPFYTGKQRDVSTGGRIDLFHKRFQILKNK